MPSVNISVVIPCYNAGNYLKETIESVLTQKGTFGQIEVIIIDDSSKDPVTIDVLNYWRRADSPVKVVTLRKNSGVAAARNRGIKAASGEWVAFIDADDIWLPGSLQIRWLVIEESPDASWLGADLLQFSDNGKCDKMGYYDQQKFSSHKVLLKAFQTQKVIKLEKPFCEFLKANLAFTGTVMVKKKIITNNGMFEESLEQAEDNHLWYRLAHHVDFYFVPKVVLKYRRHAKSLTHIERPPAEWEIRMLKLLLKDDTYRPLYKSLLRQKIASEYVKNLYYHRNRREYFQSLQDAIGALFNFPGKKLYWRLFVAALLRRE